MSRTHATPKENKEIGQQPVVESAENGQTLAPPPFSLSADGSGDAPDPNGGGGDNGPLGGGPSKSNLQESDDDASQDASPNTVKGPDFSLEAGEGAESMKAPFDPDSINIPLQFDMDQDGEQEVHHLKMKAEGDRLIPMIHSNPEPFEQFIRQNKNRFLPGNTIVVDSKHLFKLNKAGMSGKRGEKVKNLMNELALQVSRQPVRPPMLASTKPVWTREFIDVQANGRNYRQRTCKAFKIDRLSNLRNDDLVGSGPPSARGDTYYRHLFDSGSSYVQGHVLNELLGGPGKAKNLIPISSKTNTEMKDGVEDYLKKRVISEGKTVKIEATITGFGNFKPNGDEFEKAAPTNLHYKISEWRYGGKNAGWQPHLIKEFPIAHKLPGPKKEKEDKQLADEGKEYMVNITLDEPGTYRVVSDWELTEMDSGHLLLPRGSLEFVKISGDSISSHKKVINPTTVSDAMPENVPKKAMFGMLKMKIADTLEYDLSDAKDEFTLRYKNKMSESKHGKKEIYKRYLEMKKQSESLKNGLVTKKERVKKNIEEAGAPKWMAKELYQMINQIGKVIESLDEKQQLYGKHGNKVHNNKIGVWGEQLGHHNNNNAVDAETNPEDDREYLINGYEKIRDELRKMTLKYNDLYYKYKRIENWKEQPPKPPKNNNHNNSNSSPPSNSDNSQNNNNNNTNNNNTNNGNNNFNNGNSTSHRSHSHNHHHNNNNNSNNSAWPPSNTSFNLNQNNNNNDYNKNKKKSSGFSNFSPGPKNDFEIKGGNNHNHNHKSDKKQPVDQQSINKKVLDNFEQELRMLFSSFSQSLKLEANQNIDLAIKNLKGKLTYAPDIFKKKIEEMSEKFKMGIPILKARETRIAKQEVLNKWTKKMENLKTGLDGQYLKKVVNGVNQAVLLLESEDIYQRTTLEKYNSICKGSYRQLLSMRSKLVAQAEAIHNETYHKNNNNIEKEPLSKKRKLDLKGIDNLDDAQNDNDKMDSGAFSKFSNNNHNEKFNWNWNNDNDNNDNGGGFMT